MYISWPNRTCPNNAKWFNIRKSKNVRLKRKTIWNWFIIIFFILNFLYFYSREKRREGERERHQHEKHQVVASRVGPDWGLNSQARHVSRQAIEPRSTLQPPKPPWPGPISDLKKKKPLSKLRKREFLKLLKGIYQNPVANTV